MSDLQLGARSFNLEFKSVFENDKSIILAGSFAGRHNRSIQSAYDLVLKVCFVPSWLPSSFSSSQP